jgi:hypothetical protein
VSNGINERLNEEFSRRRDAFRKEHLHSLDSELQDLKNQNDYLEGFFAAEILTERGREIRRSARIIAWATVMTAGATVAAALAAWIAIYFQYCQTHNAPNESRQPPALISPTPSPH